MCLMNTVNCTVEYTTSQHNMYMFLRRTIEKILLQFSSVYCIVICNFDKITITFNNTAMRFF